MPAKPTPSSIVSLLKECAQKKDLFRGIQLHADLQKTGLLEKSSFVASSLINMYAKCGKLLSALQVHDDLHLRNIVTWSALITGYVQHGQGEIALTCFECMQFEGLSPDAVTFVTVLKACGSTVAFDKGKQIHYEIMKQDLLRENAVLGNALVDMYAKCGALRNAKQVLEQLPVQDLVCWSALIAGYAQQGQGEEALNCFLQMKSKGLTPDIVTFICILKACANTGIIDKGKEVHGEIASLGILGENVALGNALLDMYGKCGALVEAQEVLDELPVRNAVSWSTLIAGYCQQEQGVEALICFECMKQEGLSPDTVTITCILKACGSMKAVDKGKQIHDTTTCQKSLGNVVLGTAFLHMYAKCSMLAQAHGVLDELSMRDLVTWNAIISGYARQGEGEMTLNCFEHMVNEGFPPNAVTFLSILRACGKASASNKGKHVHDEIINRGLLEENTMLGNALVDMYVKLGELSKAQLVLDRLPIRNVVSWNTIIIGYAHHDQEEELLHCFERMYHDGLYPNTITYISILKYYSNRRAADKGMQIHNEVVHQGLLANDIALGNALVDMYAKCGALTQANGLLDDLPVRDANSWASVIAGYAQHGDVKQVLHCFKHMEYECTSADRDTFVSVLKACGCIGAIDIGQGIHDRIVNRGLLEEDVVLSIALISMYSKCGAFTKAQQVLEVIPVQDLAAWSALIAGYSQLELSEEALICFGRMQHGGLSPDAITLACILKACGSIGAVQKGKEVHDQIVCTGLLGKDAVLDTALIDMYAKCAVLTKAQEVFDELLLREIGSWNALISGYARQGQIKGALNCFEQLQSEGLSPDVITLTCVLNACSVSGLVNSGFRHLECMENSYGIKPSIEHQTCIVDLVGCAGCFDMAVETIKKMHDSVDSGVMFALLSACEKWGNVKTGKWAFEHAVQLDDTTATAYAIMSSIYAAASM